MNLSASRLPLLERCPAAGALPAVWTESTDAQRAGTGRHRFLQRAHELGVDVALAEIPAEAPWRAQCEALAPHAADLPHGDYELAWAYDPAADTARCLGPWLDRAYDARPGEVTGTADVVCPPAEGRPQWLVVDFKGTEAVEPAGSNLQLGFYALCVARAYDLDAVDVAIVYIEHDGSLRWDRAHLDTFALEAIAARVRAVVAAVARMSALAEPDGYATGLHCRRCPALALCPAQTRLLLALLADPPTPEGLATLSDEDAGRAWVALRVATEQLDRASAAVHARAQVRGLPLPDGGQLVPVEVTRRALDLDKALPVLRARFGQQVDAEVEQSIKAEVVARLARQIAPGKGQKKAADAVWDELAAAGAVRTTKHVQVRVKPAKEGVA